MLVYFKRLQTLVERFLIRVTCSVILLMPGLNVNQRGHLSTSLSIDIVNHMENFVTCLERLDSEAKLFMKALDLCDTFIFE
jgi:hypothetical protein